MTQTNSDPPKPERTCAKCGTPILLGGVSEFNLLRIRLLCDACWLQSQMEQGQAQVIARTEYWRFICPSEYQRTDLNHPDMPPPERSAKVLAWRFDRIGIMLHGPTRRGKTRLMWLLIRRLIEEGHSTKAVTANEFEMTCSDAAATGRMYDWFTSMTRPDILFIDDLGKEKLTDRVEASLFAVIEHRTSHDRPILLTINARDREEMKKRFSPERRAPIVERLCEFCTPIAL